MGTPAQLPYRLAACAGAALGSADHKGAIRAGLLIQQRDVCEHSCRLGRRADVAATGRRRVDPVLRAGGGRALAARHAVCCARGGCLWRLLATGLQLDGAVPRAALLLLLVVLRQGQLCAAPALVLFCDGAGEQWRLQHEGLAQAGAPRGSAL